MKKKRFVQESSNLPLLLRVYVGRTPKTVNPDRYELDGQLYRLEQLKQLGIKPTTRKSFDVDE
ncbi:MAG TPA: hypothetical protein VIQ31_10880 [Phormidium sp.]